MKPNLTRIALVTALLSLAATKTQPLCGQQVTPPAKEVSGSVSDDIGALLADYQKAFAARDFETLESHWSDNATYRDTTAGIAVDGRSEIVGLIRGAIADDPKLQLTINVERVRSLNPQTAQFDGTTMLSSASDSDGEAEQPAVFEFTGTATQSGGQWRLDAIYELAQVPDVSPAERLAPLAWLEGSWKDDVEGIDVQSDFRWLAGNNFLVRVFRADADGSSLQSGVQIIGWDPNAAQIRSWRFLSDGTFGEGVWEPSTDSWLIKSTQVMRSGTNASGTFVVTPIDDNTMTVKAVGRDVGGEPLPVGDEVTVKRVQPNIDGDVANTPEQN